jgi:hypothetical protein
VPILRPKNLVAAADLISAGGCNRVHAKSRKTRQLLKVTLVESLSQNYPKADFNISRSANPYTIDAPVLMLVEAKQGEIEFG